MFTRKFLKRWWSEALRRRVLFTALDQEDRGYLYLAMKTFDEIRNEDAGRIIVKILARLKEAMVSPFARRMETYGAEKAKTVAMKAVEWGHEKARSWMQEIGFVRYLTMLDINAR